jgi:ABC-type multidrug transport system fused ATPase/permease subunit
MERIRGSIELKDVTFSYEPNKPVLQDINLTIGAGEMVELGTHESLLKARGVYYNLEMKQRQTSRLRAVEG